MGNKSVRISKIVKEFNVGIATVIEFLKKKGIEVDANPNEKVDEQSYILIAKEFGKEQEIKKAANKIATKPLINEVAVEEPEEERELIVKSNTDIESKTSLKGPTIVGKIDIADLNRNKSVGKSTKDAPVKPIAKKPLEAEDSSAITINEPVDNWMDPEFATLVIEPFSVPAKVSGTETPEKEVKAAVAESTSHTAPVSEADAPILKTEKVTEEVKVETNIEPELFRAKDSVPEIRQPKVIETIQLNQTEKKTPQLKTIKKIVLPSKVNTAKPDEVAVTKEPIAPNEPIERIEPEFITTKVEQLTGPNVIGKIDLKQFEVKKPESRDAKKKRQRIKKDGKVNVVAETGPKLPRKPSPILNKNPQAQQAGGQQNQSSHAGGQHRGQQHGGQQHGVQPNPAPSTKVLIPKELKKRDKNKPLKPVVADDDAVQRQVKDTLARLTAPKGKTKSSKYRRDKRDQVSQRHVEELERQDSESNILQLTEFVTVNELASMIDAPVVRVIEACMNLGLMVSINQRLDAEALVLVAEEFGFKIEFVTADLQDSIEVEIDKEEDLLPRSPVIAVMGHVDHGKTSLLDYIRKANVIAGEAGGITQHIGAYSVKMPDGRQITFLDTPGHEAFTAMRARGAKVTDLAIIIIAADDAVMPQTIEAINHAVAAGVPMVFALNKIDKPGANPEKIREQLSQMNFLLEDWGGKYQSQEIAAKSGLNVDKLLEKVLLEADMLELKANKNKRALGTVIESSLDKGRGFVTTLLVQSGTLKVGDIVLSGSFTGRVKAMFNERGTKIETAGPSTPALILGLNGAPTAGEAFNVMEGEKEAREIASKREQLIRMQGLRTKKHITLDEIGRRIAIGSFKELNIVVKADMDGSVEALSDSLIQLSTEEIQVNVIHKAVGAVSESDVMLAAASNAIIIGFQVRPSVSARKIAEKEEIEIRLYSVIYDAIDEVKDGIEGMLEPIMKEEITATVEVLEVFKITKVGSVAGCIVREGKITRNTSIRLIRDGIVVFSGKLGSLKRFKDDVKDVGNGYECGLNIDNFNDIRVGDMVEAFELVEIKRKL